MDAIPASEVTDEGKKAFGRQVALRAQNARMVAEIEAMGFSVDVANARIDHMWLALYHTGVLTTTQLAEIQLDFEEDLRKTLQASMQQAREQYDAMQRERRSAALSVPPSARRKRTLFVPGQGEVEIGSPSAEK